MIRRFSGPVTTFAFAALIAVAGESVSAHHSFAVFDLTTQKSIEGTVKKVDWTNPHGTAAPALQCDADVLES